MKIEYVVRGGRWALAALALVLSSISGQAYAEDCRVVSVSGYRSEIPNRVLVSRASISVGAQAVTGSFRAGQRIGSIQATFNDNRLLDGCPMGSSATSWIYPAKAATGVTWNGYAVYPTGVAGIGYALWVKDRNRPGLPVTGNNRVFSGKYDYDLGLSATIYFVATATLSSGTYTIPAQRLALFRPAEWIREPPISFGNSSELFLNSFSLSVTAPTCDLAAGDVNRTITLNTVRVSDFNNANSAGARDFELTATCSMASSVTFAFSGTPAAGDDYRFANTGTARGIGLQLYSRIGGVAHTIRANGTDSRRTVAVSGNRAVLPLGASYWKNGTVSKGTLASTATVTISYN